MPALDDQLFESRFRGVFEYDDHVFTADRLDMGVDEDEVAVMELGLHADAVDAQDIGVLTAGYRAGKQFITSM